MIHPSQYQKLQALGIPIPLSNEKADFNQKRFNQLCQQIRENNICVLAHYYVDEHLQKLAEKTGGIVSDSLEMAKFGANSTADTLIVCGVKFMGETAKILTFNKQILMPDLDAQCSLDLSCPLDQFQTFCNDHPGRTVVVYANTSAQIKGMADWVVTSSIAIDVIKHLKARDKKIIWGPDKYLGDYLQKQTGADMLLWDGACIVHESFQIEGLEKLLQQYPEAALIAHPESPPAILEKACVIGSTSRLIQASCELPNNTLIVGTDPGILYQMKKASPHKTFLPTPTGGHGATCQSCNFCPWMAMNSLEGIENCLKEPHQHEIQLPRQIAINAAKPIQKMLTFAKQLQLPTDGNA